MALRIVALLLEVFGILATLWALALMALGGGSMGPMFQWFLIGMALFIAGWLMLRLSSRGSA